jgi:CheY-like chemotaxis protein
VPPSQKTILVVEDDDDLRAIFRRALRAAGFHVLEAADGPDALRLIDIAAPDLVVLDLRLPSLDGFAVRDELASNPRTKNVPVVVVTGMAALDIDRLKGARLLHKPVLPEDLIANVRASLATTIGQRHRSRTAGGQAS